MNNTVVLMKRIGHLYQPTFAALKNKSFKHFSNVKIKNGLCGGKHREVVYKTISP